MPASTMITSLRFHLPALAAAVHAGVAHPGVEAGQSVFAEIVEQVRDSVTSVPDPSTIARFRSRSVDPGPPIISLSLVRRSRTQRAPWPNAEDPGEKIGRLVNGVVGERFFSASPQASHLRADEGAGAACCSPAARASECQHAGDYKLVPWHGR
jgi:hypothetical protein